jgi:DNA-binding winged helix-turn-helix (wHTH) protein
MAGPVGSGSVFRFGVFELDLRAGELRKRGIRIKIQEQPIEILGLLLECPGEVVTREQIQNKLWNGNTFVDFDNAINGAVRKVRDALGDNSENPRFVETLPGRGYRFIAPVNQDLTAVSPFLDDQAAPLSPSPLARSASQPPEIDIGVAKPDVGDAVAATEEPAVAPAVKRSSMRRWIVWGAGAFLIAAGAAVWQARRTPPQELWSGVMLGGPANAYQPRLSPDGQLLAFLTFVDQLTQLAVMRPNGGSWTVLTSDREHGCIATTAWSPDGSKIYFDRVWGYPLGIYSVPALGGQPRTLLDKAFGPEPLPDGTMIVVKTTDKGDNQLFHF